MTQNPANPDPTPDRDRSAGPHGPDATQAFSRADGATDPATGRSDAGNATTSFARQDTGTGTAWSESPTSTFAAPTDHAGAAPHAGATTHVEDDRAIGEPDPDRPAVVKTPRGTLDLGLLLLRVGLGLVLLGHGVQKLFALFDGPGINGFEGLLTQSGYDQPGLLAYVGAITETAAGALLVLGLLTPLAGAAALGTMINAWLVADQGTPGFQFFVSAQGQEYELLLVVLSAVVILTGPGRYSLDFGRKWATRPFVGSFVALLVGVGAGLAVWFLLNGATPFA